MAGSRASGSKHGKAGPRGRRPGSQPSSHGIHKPQHKTKTSNSGGKPQDPSAPSNDRVRTASRATEAAMASGDSDLEDFPQPPNAHKFSYLKPTRRHVSQDRVITEWKSMPEQAQERIADLLLVAQRGVVNTAKSAKRAEEMNAAVEPLLRRIVSRLPRMLAPPKSKEENFNLEKLLERSRLLEAQLTASLHSIELLKAEIGREEDGLASDEKKATEIENNFKAEEALWRKQARRNQTSSELPEDLDMLDDGADDIGLVQTDDNVLEMLAEESDEDLAPILQQLSNHLESIYGNSMQLKGVTTALEDSSLALEPLINR